LKHQNIKIKLFNQKVRKIYNFYQYFILKAENYFVVEIPDDKEQKKIQYYSIEDLKKFGSKISF